MWSPDVRAAVRGCGAFRRWDLPGGTGTLGVGCEGCSMAHPFHLNFPASWLVPCDKHLPLSASRLHYEGLYSVYEPEQCLPLKLLLYNNQ